MPYRLFGGVRWPLNAPCPENVRRLDTGILPMVASMQSRGILIDPDHFSKFSVQLQSDMDDLTDTVEMMSGKRINVASPDQVAWLLFDHLGMKPGPGVKKTKTGKRYKVDDEVLQGMIRDHEVIRPICDFRERDKLKDSFCDKLPRMADEDGRVRGNIRVTRVVTGRISMTEPNLMAIPTRTKLGQQIRAGFIAEPGRVLGTIDLSQIQMRAAAHEAQCVAMIDTFLRDGDIHSETASRMFGIPVDKLDKMQHRYPAKRVGFGVLFGITPEGLLDQMVMAGAKGWDVDRCAKVIKLWFDAYPEIDGYMMGQHARARRFGMVWDSFGRHRWVPETKSVHRWIVEAALRAAANMPIQGFEQGVMKICMAMIQDLINRKYRDAVWPLLQVHDELLFSCEEDAAEDFFGDAKDLILQSVPMDVPIKSGYATGQRWSELEK